MKYLILGLGIYGENLARDLTDSGNDVIGADINPLKAAELKDYISAVYIIDASEESQLAILPLLNVDLVIVAIGENFGASIKAVALLKKSGVKHIYARAIDTLHEAILESFGIDRIITPEQRAASDLCSELELGAAVKTMRVDADTMVAQFSVTDYLVDMNYDELRRRLDEGYGLKIVAADRPVDEANILGIKHEEPRVFDTTGEKVKAGDRLSLFGPRAKFTALFRKIR